MTNHVVRPTPTEKIYTAYWAWGPEDHPTVRPLRVLREARKEEHRTVRRGGALEEDGKLRVGSKVRSVATARIHDHLTVSNGRDSG